MFELSFIELIGFRIAEWLKAYFGFVGGRFLIESSTMMSCGIEGAADGPLRSNDSDLEVPYVVTCFLLLLDDRGDVELPGRDLFVQTIIANK